MYNYTKVSAKFGVGAGFDMSAGPSYGHDDFGNCPKGGCVLKEELTMGPWTGGMDHNGNISHSLAPGMGLSIGWFLECEYITSKTFIDCCD